MFLEVIKMDNSAKILVRVLGFSTALVVAGLCEAAPKSGEVDNGEVLFKIHDVVPEKDNEGKVLYCNVGATFYNRTKIDIANAAINLSWEDEVIGDAIDQEERAEKERKRLNSRSAAPRYGTAGFTGKTIKTSIKLPPLKMNQQVSMKTKVDTDRCFLLLNEMDVNVTNCGTASMNDRVSRQGCDNLFRYVGPKDAEYYTEFKELSPEQMMAVEDAELAKVKNEINATYEATVVKIKDITNEVNAELAKKEETAEEE